MEIERQFIFRANAAAFGGRLIFPADVSVDGTCSAALGPVGGRSESKVGAQRFGTEIRIKSASTFAEGIFDDAKAYEQVTRQHSRSDALTTTTRVSADTLGVSVGTKPKFTATRIRAALNSTSPGSSGESPVGVGEDSILEDVAIDGYKLLIELNPALFNKYNTRAKLLAAADEPRRSKDVTACLMMTAKSRERYVPKGGLVIGTTYIHATIVKKISWEKEPYPGSTIEDNKVTIPEFGRLFFGELLIGEGAKRLTMLRMNLGSPFGGDIMFASVEDNGTWSP